MTTQEKSRQGFWQSLLGRDWGLELHEALAEPVIEAPARRPSVPQAPCKSTAFPKRRYTP
jgi:hypothetical protein